MSQSVKLKDGSYIDASGVWDANQKTDMQNIVEALTSQVHIKELDQLNQTNGDVYQHMAAEPYCFFYVINGDNQNIANWIGEVNGAVLRINIFAFAVNGWSQKLYFNLLWGTDWKGWILIK